MMYGLIAAVLVAVDQLVKYLVMTRIPLGEHVPFIPYILDLTYVTNTGAPSPSFQSTPGRWRWCRWSCPSCWRPPCG